MFFTLYLPVIFLLFYQLVCQCHVHDFSVQSVRHFPTQPSTCTHFSGTMKNERANRRGCRAVARDWLPVSDLQCPQATNERHPGQRSLLPTGSPRRLGLRYPAHPVLS